MLYILQLNINLVKKCNITIKNTVLILPIGERLVIPASRR